LKGIVISGWLAIHPTRTTNAIERLNEEFRRQINSQAVLLWALLAAGQIQMRKVDGRETLSQPLEPMALGFATWAEPISRVRTMLPGNFHQIRATTVAIPEGG
jgi:hypothetical protein